MKITRRKNNFFFFTFSHILFSHINDVFYVQKELHRCPNSWIFIFFDDEVYVQRLKKNVNIRKKTSREHELFFFAVFFLIIFSSKFSLKKSDYNFLWYLEK